MSGVDVWSDFETLRHNVKHNTVDRLKQILTGFNAECGTGFTKAGKKQDLIDRITRELDAWRRNNSTEKWVRGKAILIQVRNTGTYTHSSVMGGEPAHASTSTSQYPAPLAVPNGVYTSTSASSNANRFDFTTPRKTAGLPAVAPPAASTSSTASIRFKTSPFFKPERAVSAIVECPESTSQVDRRQQHVNFTLSHDVFQKVSSPGSKYQLRLYCTSSTYYSNSLAFRGNLGPCPIEFPPTCEVRVNGVQLSANLKGLKKKPGTAPPPDIGADLKMVSNSVNRVDMVYVNSQQPVQSKKYYMVVMLVEVTTVDQCIATLRKGKYISSNEIIDKMNKAAAADDDIVAGHQKMSLKCPLSYMRITTPSRSLKCVHSQCFDAFSWYSVMEQTTTWLCPVCEKVLNPDELMVDGYFDDILKNTPEDLEDVIVEPDGQWHTTDNTYGSAAWKAAHPAVVVKTASSPPPLPRRRSFTPPAAKVGEGKAKSGPSNAEIVILDSDDEEEGEVKRELSPSNHGTQRNGRVTTDPSFASFGAPPPRSQTVESDVIDLTLDSDDEQPPRTVPLTRKRKPDDRDTSSPTEPIWKKSRADASTSSPASTSVTTPGSGGAGPSGVYANGLTSQHSPPRNTSQRPPPPPPPASYATGNYPAGYHALPPRPTRPAAPHMGHQSSSTAPYLPRPNGSAFSSSSHWRS